MGFKQKEADKLLADTGRRCCICGTRHSVALHHIVPSAQGGPDEIDNAISLCPNCHDRVHGSAASGRTTRAYTPNELKLHRQRTIDIVKVEAAIEGQEAGRDVLPDEQIEAALAPLRQRLAKLQGEAPVAGTRGVAIKGDVRNSTIITGNGNVLIGQYTGAAAQDDDEALAIYRRVVAGICQHLPLRGIDLGASDAIAAQPRLDLAQVYVDLDTKAQVPLDKGGKRRRPKRAEPLEDREARPLRALEAAAQHRRLVILGDPGSGKSTFLNHLALCLAANGLEPDGTWLSRLPDWPAQEGGSLPLCVVLRDFARWLAHEQAADEPRCLWGFVVERLKAQNLEFAADPIERALESGGCTVMLDGLDEIPTVELRRAVRDAVAAFAERYERSRFVVTCRTLSYQDPVWRLGYMPSFELAPLDEEKIERFLQAWYRELAKVGVVRPSDAEAFAQRLGQAVRQPDLWRLATNPLLLTVMALVHTHQGQLPDARALLYEETVEILLWRWEQVKVGGKDETPVLRRLLREAGRTDVDLKRVLWRLAFDAHRQGGSGDDDVLADIGELELEKALAELHPEKSRDWAHAVMEVMKLRAGLLIERAPDTYTFPHRTFQEYLAGAHLSSQADFAKQATQLVAEAPFWREVALLGVGRLVHHGGDVDKPLALVGELCPKRAPRSDGAWRKAWLAGEALLEMGLNRVQDGELGRDLSDRVRQRLASLLSKGRLSPVERSSAAVRWQGSATPASGPTGTTCLMTRCWASSRSPPGRSSWGARRSGTRMQTTASCRSVRSSCPCTTWPAIR